MLLHGRSKGVIVMVSLSFQLAHLTALEAAGSTLPIDRDADLSLRLARLARAEQTLAASLAPVAAAVPRGGGEALAGAFVEPSMARALPRPRPGPGMPRKELQEQGEHRIRGTGTTSLAGVDATIAGMASLASVGGHDAIAAWSQKVPMFLAGPAKVGSSPAASIHALSAGTRSSFRKRVTRMSSAGLGPAAYLWLSAEPGSKGGSSTCEPACAEAHGVCVNNVCLCKHPYSGLACEGTVATSGEEPLSKELAEGGVAEKWFGSSAAEALRDRVSIPLAAFIWSSVFAITCICTAACPGLFSGLKKGGPKGIRDESEKGWFGGEEYERGETQHDIVEAWVLDSRRRFEREHQTEPERREWFEHTVGERLQAGKAGWSTKKH